MSVQHLKHSHVGVVGAGGHVAATGHGVMRRLHVQLTSQDALVRDLLLTNTHRELTTNNGLGEGGLGRFSPGLTRLLT